MSGENNNNFSSESLANDMAQQLFSESKHPPPAAHDNRTTTSFITSESLHLEFETLKETFNQVQMRLKSKSAMALIDVEELAEIIQSDVLPIFKNIFVKYISIARSMVPVDVSMAVQVHTVQCGSCQLKHDDKNPNPNNVKTTYAEKIPVDDKSSLCCPNELWRYLTVMIAYITLDTFDQPIKLNHLSIATDLCSRRSSDSAASLSLTTDTINRLCLFQLQVPQYEQSTICAWEKYIADGGVGPLPQPVFQPISESFRGSLSEPPDGVHGCLSYWKILNYLRHMSSDTTSQTPPWMTVLFDGLRSQPAAAEVTPNEDNGEVVNGVHQSMGHSIEHGNCSIRQHEYAVGNSLADAAEQPAGACYYHNEIYESSSELLQMNPELLCIYLDNVDYLGSDSSQLSPLILLQTLNKMAKSS
eukprot:GHVH01012567.1.p1 GENE.GHVH01012567.1~~GHVH01012567.1.p1  ORF type:complete len:416 (-),score=48.71 GHVH01012567.1:347-1594(-)